MTGLTFLIIGGPLALFRFALARFRRQQAAAEVEPERGEAWPFDEIRARHPWLGEMEVRP